MGQNKNWLAEMRIYGLGGDAEMTNKFFSFEVVPKREVVKKSEIRKNVDLKATYFCPYMEV